MVTRRKLDRNSVFLNVPFDLRYRPLLHALICSLACMGRKARSAMELTETGKLRLERIVALIGECAYSIHDLSRNSGSNRQPRHNMPFEAGIAYAFKTMSKGKHGYEFYVLEGKKHSLKTSFSDLSGMDPKAHGNDPKEVVNIVVSWFHAIPSEFSRPEPVDVIQVYSQFRKIAIPGLNKRWNGMPPFNYLVAGSLELAQSMGFYPAKKSRSH